MTLKDAITIHQRKGYLNNFNIEYYTEWNDKYLFTGACRYSNGELKSLDGDNYYLDDVITSFESNNFESTLCVYYESEWVENEED